MPRFLDFDAPDFAAQFTAFLGDKREASVDVDDAVAAILRDVETRGDAAIIELTSKFDRLDLTPETFAFTAAEIDAAIATVPPAEAEALTLAAERIRAYHARQLPQDESWTDDVGAELGWRWTPVDAAGLYVPGGLASYPSSVLMNAIPAQVAGVKRLVITAPTPDGTVNPLVLLAARLSGVETVLKLGGAQAIAALAYGTDTIQAVDKITGPGNAYVAAAKRRVFGRVGIDMIAGPSEILVVADKTADPDWIAIDLLSQAEHDASAQSILITDDPALAPPKAGKTSAPSSPCPTSKQRQTSPIASPPNISSSAPQTPTQPPSPMQAPSSSAHGPPKPSATTLAGPTTSSQPQDPRAFPRAFLCSTS